MSINSRPQPRRTSRHAALTSAAPGGGVVTGFGQPSAGTILSSTSAGPHQPHIRTTECSPLAPDRRFANLFHIILPSKQHGVSGHRVSKHLFVRIHLIGLGTLARRPNGGSLDLAGLPRWA